MQVTRYLRILKILYLEGVHHIAVTFDDGFQSFLDSPLPVLQQMKIPIVLFIPAGCLGQSPSWINNPDHVFAQEEIMSEQQLKKLPSNLVKIGSHCLTHPRLTTLDVEKIQLELCESKDKLQGIIEREVATLSFPYNDYNEQVVELAQQAGYSRAFSNIPPSSISKTDTFLQGRVGVSTDDLDVEYWLKLRGAYSWVPIAIATKKRIFARLKLIRPKKC